MKSRGDRRNGRGEVPRNPVEDAYSARVGSHPQMAGQSPTDTERANLPTSAEW